MRGALILLNRKYIFNVTLAVVIISLGTLGTIGIYSADEPRQKSFAEKSLTNKYSVNAERASDSEVSAGIYSGLVYSKRTPMKFKELVKTTDVKPDEVSFLDLFNKNDSHLVVGNVDTQKIYKCEYIFLSRFNMSSFLSGNQITAEASKYNWKTKVNGTSAKEQVKKNTLEQLHELKLQLIKAKEAGIKLEKTDLDSIDSEILQQYGTRSAAEIAIKEGYGISLADFEVIYKSFTLAQKYQQKEKSKITVSDADVKKHYDKNKKDFDKVTVTHILISTLDINRNELSVDKVAAAKKKAEGILAKVKAGQDIKVLATMYSEDPGVKENKGVYTFGKGEMVKEFEDWSFKSHKTGDLGLIKTQFGYHIMQFNKRVESPFDSIKDSLKMTLQMTKANEAFTKSLEAWKKQSKYAVKINNDEISKIDKILYGF